MDRLSASVRLSIEPQQPVGVGVHCTAPTHPPAIFFFLKLLTAIYWGISR
jgi:hypothetical protein